MVKHIKALSFLKFAALLILIFCIFISVPVLSEGDDLQKGQSTYFRENSYNNYLNGHMDSSRPDNEIIISADSYTAADMPVEVVQDFEGYDGKAVTTAEEGYIEWKVNIETEGLYNVGMLYYPIAGKESAIEREFLIDGNIPFFEANNLTFQRIWRNKEKIKTDSRGNELVPIQEEAPCWTETLFRDLIGYYNEPYQFYFTKGEHTLRLNSIKEPMTIAWLKLYNNGGAPAYEAVLQEYSEKGYKPVEDFTLKIQAEDITSKSDPAILPTYDRSSPKTEPYHWAKIRLNTIGGSMRPWFLPGQWAAWEVDVPEDGLYKIGIKGRQDQISGVFTTRKLYIDGKVPFKEVEKITFDYETDWQMKELGDGQEPYLFYLTKGKHQLKLETVIGDFSPVLRQMEESVLILNDAYLKIVMITGTMPDTNRDYNLDDQLPGVIKIFEEQSAILQQTADEIVAFTGKRGQRITLLETTSRQLADMVKNPETIPARLNNFVGNVDQLSYWLLDIRLQPLEIDYFVIADKDEKLPEANASFFARLWHEIRAMVASFTEDYNVLSDAEKGKKQVTVWVSGMDQGTVLKELVESRFTPETGIGVNVKMPAGSTLIQASMAGVAPDVALQVAGQNWINTYLAGSGAAYLSTPVNLATRRALVDLSQFTDCTEVEKRFMESSLTPFRFNNGLFALPETVNFPMMYYRKDILDELGLKIPETWDEVYSLIGDLQKKNLNFGAPDMVTYLYQYGAELYKNEGAVSALDSDIAIEAFKKWCSFYVNYKLPVQLDAWNHFRNGDVPVMVVNMAMYNYLQVFAPHLKGLWDIAPVPGLVRPDGTINRDVASVSTGCVMMRDTKDKEAAWEFMKWWTNDETQADYENAIEGLQGSAGRIFVANVKAHEKLPWTKSEYEKLMGEWKYARGMPDVPGGYYTDRQLTYAFRKVYDEKGDPRETLLDYVNIINEELKSKRKEFGLE